MRRIALAAVGLAAAAFAPLPTASASCIDLSPVDDCVGCPSVVVRVVDKVVPHFLDCTL